MVSGGRHTSGGRDTGGRHTNGKRDTGRRDTSGGRDTGGRHTNGERDTGGRHTNGERDTGRRDTSGRRDTGGRWPDPADHEWEFERHGTVGVWYLDGWQGWANEELETVSEHYRERGSQPDVTATIAVFGDETSLPRETQEYMGEQWSDNGRYVGVERIGFVAEGVTGMAVTSQVDVPGADLAEFDDLEAALAWAGE